MNYENPSIKFRYKGAKRICVFANYRSASSYIHNTITTVNSNVPLGEYFAEVNPNIDGPCENKDTNNTFSYEKAIKNLQSIPRYTVKLMANQLQFDDTKIKSVLDIVDKVVYVYRRDFIAQGLSLLSVAPHKLYSVMGFRESGQAPSIIDVPILSQEYIDRMTNILRDNYTCMAKYIKTYPGEIICLEDIVNQKPYLKTTVWNQPIPEFEDFNVEKVLFG